MQSFPNIEEMIYKAGPITNCMKIIEKMLSNKSEIFYN